MIFNNFTYNLNLKRFKILQLAPIREYFLKTNTLKGFWKKVPIRNYRKPLRFFVKCRKQIMM